MRETPELMVTRMVKNPQRRLTLGAVFGIVSASSLCLTLFGAPLPAAAAKGDDAKDQAFVEYNQDGTTSKIDDAAADGLPANTAAGNAPPPPTDTNPSGGYGNGGDGGNW